MSKDPTPKQIGAAVLRHRKTQRFTQQKLADLAGVSVSMVQSTEQGRTSGEPYKLTLILRALGFNTVDDLMAGAERGRGTRDLAGGEPKPRYSPEWFAWYRARTEQLPEPARSMGLQAADEAERWIEQLSHFDPSTV